MAARKQPEPYLPRLKLQVLLRIFVIAMALYLLIAGFSGLQGSFRAMRTADARLLVVAFIAIAGSYVCAALTYMCLSPKSLRLMPTLWVEVAGGLVNRMLPGGLGGLGLNALYLKKQGVALSQATAVVGINNAIGFIGNALLLGAVAFAGHGHLVPFRALPQPWLMIAGAVVAGIAIAIVLHYRRAQTRAVLRSIAGYGRLLAGRPLRSIGALCSSIGLTALHATGLYVVLVAAHVPVNWPMALLAISGGAVAGALIPTPGGVGGAEAGITSVLVSLGVVAPTAAAVAIMYRGITYWLPLLPGYLALRVAEKRYL